MKINFSNFKFKFKNFFVNLIYRLKPRWQFRWILTFVIWIIVLAYVGFGIYFGREIYIKHSENSKVVFSTKIYPFPAAFVGGNIIWTKEYYQQLSYIRRFSDKTKQATPSEQDLRAQIIDQLIENRLLSWEAAKNGIRVTSKDVDDAFGKIVDQSGGLANVQKTLRDLYDMSESEFKGLVHDQVVKEKIQDELIAQVKVSHILVKDEGRANEVAQKAKNGEDWAGLAKTYSEDIKTRDSAGDLGWLARGNLVIDNKQVPEFEEAAFAAKIGEIFGPVKSQVGFQIGKVEDKKGKVQLSYNNWLSNIKKETKIYIFIK
ncbi:MAG: peptidylprolyl isomerase [Patescibacteria group bacterium]|nr:peptidylprolyl isomerase [Patescibacteria group bacterium]